MSKYQPSEQEKEAFVSRAIELSRQGLAQGHGAPFGAVIVKDGKVIAEGYNRIAVDLDITAHGEMTAIRNACKNLKSWDLSGCHLYTSCEPCFMCFSAIWLSRSSEAKAVGLTRFGEKRRPGQFTLWAIVCIERVYYGVSLKKAVPKQVPTNADFALPIEERSVPGEQIKSKAEEAYDAVMEWDGKFCFNHTRSEQ